MHIHLNSQVIKEVLNSFQSTVSHLMTAQQKRIAAVAAIALGALAISYLVKRCCFSASVIKKEEEIEISDLGREEKPFGKIEESEEEIDLSLSESNDSCDAQDPFPNITSEAELDLEENMLNIQARDDRDQTPIKLDVEILTLTAKIASEEKSIAEQQAKIQGLEGKRAALVTRIQQMSEGYIESPMDEHTISFSPDDDIILPDGTTVKACNYQGNLTHSLTIDSSYQLIAEDVMPEKKGFFMFIKGKCYELIEENKRDWAPSTYHFKTIWEGNGVLPEIKIYRRYLKSFIYNSDILNHESSLNQLDKEIKWEEERLIGYLEGLDWLQIQLKEVEGRKVKLGELEI